MPKTEAKKEYQKTSARPAKAMTADQRKKAKAAFLEGLRSSGVIQQGLIRANIDRHTALLWKKNDEEFAKAWVEAEEAALDELEEAMRGRAIRGVDRPVFYRGDVVGSITEYSDSNAQFLMKAKRYKEDRLEITGKDGAPLPVQAAPLVVEFIDKREDKK
jgi:hypothetical protein